MSTIDKVIKLKVDLLTDFNETVSTDAVFYSQDHNSALVEFDVFEGETSVNLSDRSMAGSLAIQCADGATFINDDVVINENKMTFTLSQEQLLHAGRANAELFIIENDKRISALTFKFKIKLSLVDVVTPSNAMMITLRTLFDEYVGTAPKVDLSPLEVRLTNIESKDADMTYQKAIDLGMYDFVDENSFKATADEKRNALLTDSMMSLKSGDTYYNIDEFIYSQVTRLQTQLQSMNKISNAVNYGILSSQQGTPQEFVDYQNLKLNSGLSDITIIDYLFEKNKELESRLAVLESK